MDILFVHQNFPGQFLHLAPALEERGHRVVALTDQHNERPSPVSENYRYRAPEYLVELEKCRLGKTYTQMSERGLMAARAARTLRDRHGFRPDVVFGHIGWGESLYLRDIWPEARHLIYAEYYYATQGQDTGFDAEFTAPSFDRDALTTARQAHLAHAMAQVDAALAPTFWQAGTFPPCFRGLISVIHDGVDTAQLRPDPAAQVTLQDGTVLRAGDEVLTYVGRNLEPYRGYHIFMRALPEILARRPNAQAVIIGADGVSYGSNPPEGRTWKEVFLDEVADRLDMSRVHFVGRLPYDQFVRVLQISRVHAYLTYPFVLSWSLLEAMSIGAHVVASRTAPVEEVIAHGETGTLVDFFDVPGWAEALSAGLADPRAHDALRAAAREQTVSRYDLRTVTLPRLIEFVEGETASDAQGARAG